MLLISCFLQLIISINLKIVYACFKFLYLGMLYIYGVNKRRCAKGRAPRKSKEVMNYDKRIS